MNSGDRGYNIAYGKFFYNFQYFRKRRKDWSCGHLPFVLHKTITRHQVEDDGRLLLSGSHLQPDYSQFGNGFLIQGYGVSPYGYCCLKETPSLEKGNYTGGMFFFCPFSSMANTEDGSTWIAPGVSSLMEIESDSSEYFLCLEVDETTSVHRLLIECLFDHFPLRGCPRNSNGDRRPCQYSAGLPIQCANGDLVAVGPGWSVILLEYL